MQACLPGNECAVPICNDDGKMTHILSARTNWKADDGDDQVNLCCAAVVASHLAKRVDILEKTWQMYFL